MLSSNGCRRDDRCPFFFIIIIFIILILCKILKNKHLGEGSNKEFAVIKKNKLFLKKVKKILDTY